MGALFSSTFSVYGNGRSRHVFASYYLTDGNSNPGNEQINPRTRRSYTMTINGKEGVTVRKPQMDEGRPFFAADNDTQNYGIFSTYYKDYVSDGLQQTVPDPNRRIKLLYGPPLKRWLNATESLAARSPKCLHSMSLSMCPGSTGEPSNTLSPDMMWPAEKHYYEMSDKVIKSASFVVWNAAYRGAQRPYDTSREVLQYGPVLIYNKGESKGADDALGEEKLKSGGWSSQKLASQCNVVDPKSFLKSMTDSSKKRRWIVLVGGYQSSTKADAKSFESVAFQLGKSIGSQWSMFAACDFAGILTQSGAGFCDTVSWEEEVSRGFCEVEKSAPIYHVRDSNLVSTEGSLVDVPFGHGVVLDSQNATPAWKGDYTGANRDMLLSMLAQDGVVLYGGQSSTAELSDAIGTFSMSAPLPPLMSVVVGGAFPEKRVSVSVGQAIKRDVNGDIDSGMFNQAIVSRNEINEAFSYDMPRRDGEIVSFMQSYLSASRNITDKTNLNDMDFFYRQPSSADLQNPQTNDFDELDYDDDRYRFGGFTGYEGFTGYDGSQNRQQTKNLIEKFASRLPVLYQSSSNHFTRERAFLSKDLSITGIGSSTPQMYTTNIINNIATRLQKKQQRQ